MTSLTALTTLSLITLLIALAPAAHAEGGTSGGGGDVFVAEYNDLRATWAKRFDWLVKDPSVMQECEHKGQCPDKTPSGVLARHSQPLWALMSMDSQWFEIRSTPEYIGNLPAYSESLPGARYRTRFDYRYWQSLSAFQQEVLVLHENLVILEIETTNDMAISEALTQQFADSLKGKLTTSPLWSSNHASMARYATSGNLKVGDWISYEVAGFEAGIYKRYDFELRCVERQQQRSMLVDNYTPDPLHYMHYQLVPGMDATFDGKSVSCAN